MKTLGNTNVKLLHWSRKNPRFTIGVICTATVDGDVPVSRNEDTEEIVEELKLVEPQLDYIEDEYTEQEVIDGMQTEMKSMKSFDVYDEIPIEHCSQEDIDMHWTVLGSNEERLQLK